MHNGMQFIDAHIHCEHVTSIGPVMDIMQQMNLDAVNFLSSSQYRETHMAQNAVGMYVKSLYPGKVYFFGGLQHMLPGASESDLNLARQAQMLVEAGCDGFKMLEGKPNCYKRVGKHLNGPEFQPFYEYVQSQGLSILWHASDPLKCWDASCPESYKKAGWFYDSTFPTDRQIRQEVEWVLKNFPKLKIIFAHFFLLSENVDNARRFLDTYPCAFLDLTPGTDMYIDFSAKRREWRQFFVDYQDRILFGTDDADNGAPMAGVNNIRRILRFLETEETGMEFGQEVRGIALDKPVLEKIFAGNFLRIVGKAIKPLNRERCLKFCDWITDFAKRSTESKAILANLEPSVEGIKKIQN